MRTTSRPSPSSARGTGFTLVELLVVIGVVAILMGLLFPVVSTAQQKAYEADCQNNLKQLGAALYNYATSTDGYFPAATDFTGDQTALLDAMADYMPRTAPSWFCKSEGKRSSRTIKNGPTNGVIGYYYWAWTSGGAVDPATTSNRWHEPVFTGITLNRSNFTGQVLFSDRFMSQPDEQYHAGRDYNVDLTTEGTHILYGGGSVKKIKPVYGP